MTDTPETFEEEERRLCPDDACIGLLGDDDRCKVCGRLADGTEAAPAPETVESEPEEGEDDRRLCPDGTCIGLLDETGHCKVCGASGNP